MDDKLKSAGRVRPCLDVEEWKKQNDQGWKYGLSLMGPEDILTHTVYWSLVLISPALWEWEHMNDVCTLWTRYSQLEFGAQSVAHPCMKCKKRLNNNEPDVNHTSHHLHIFNLCSVCHLNLLRALLQNSDMEQCKDVFSGWISTKHRGEINPKYLHMWVEKASFKKPEVTYTCHAMAALSFTEAQWWFELKPCISMLLCLHSLCSSNVML